MRIIAIAGLNIDYINAYDSSRKKLHALSKLPEADCILVCGDIAEYEQDLRNHTFVMRVLDDLDVPVAYVAGNHDCWGGQDKGSGDVLDELGKFDGSMFCYLEHRNLDLGEIVFAGTYGHYDYSLSSGDPNDNITSEHSSSTKEQQPYSHSVLMRWHETDENVFRRLIADFEERIKDVDKPLITVSHMFPNNKVSGHQVSAESDLFAAYSVTRSLEQVIMRYNPVLHFCGHSHATPSQHVGDTNVINLGNGLDSTFRYVLYDTDYEEVFENQVDLDAL